MRTRSMGINSYARCGPQPPLFLQSASGGVKPTYSGVEHDPVALLLRDLVVVVYIGFYQLWLGH